MKTVSEIRDFFGTLSADLDVNNYLDDSQVESIDSFDQLVEELDNAFNECGEIIYYSNAIKYLMENDPSLHESIDLANDMGFELSNINSELLATIHNQNRIREEFMDLESEVDDFFSEY